MNSISASTFTALIRDRAQLKERILHFPDPIYSTLWVEHEHIEWFSKIIFLLLADM